MLLIAAGVALMPLSFLSFALVTLPLLVPAALLIAAGIDLDRTWPGPAGREILAGACVIAFGLAAMVALLSGPDTERGWTTSNGGGSVSDVVTRREGLTGAAFLAAALVAPVLVTPRRNATPR
jgi:hypothetical protein